jgi:hypothetical protein
MSETKCNESTDTVASGHRRCVQPVDEKELWDFFACRKACEHEEEHTNVQGRNIDTDSSLQTRTSHSSWECGAHQGIPQCLGARLSRRLPGDLDFFHIDTNDLYASAVADARLSQVFALLQKPTKECLYGEVSLRKEEGYQLDFLKAVLSEQGEPGRSDSGECSRLPALSGRTTRRSSDVDACDGEELARHFLDDGACVDPVEELKIAVQSQT